MAQEIGTGDHSPCSRVTFEMPYTFLKQKASDVYLSEAFCFLSGISILQPVSETLHLLSRL